MKVILDTLVKLVLVLLGGALGVLIGTQVFPTTPEATTTTPVMYDTVKVYDTIPVRDTILDTVQVNLIESVRWSTDDIILLVKYAKTQAPRVNDDNWLVLQTMINRCSTYNVSMQGYYANPKINNSQTIQRIQSGVKYRRHTFSWNSTKDVTMFHRVISCLSGNVPDSLVLSPHVLYFESHDDPNWNVRRTSGIFQRKDLCCKKDHEFYYHPDTPKSKRQFPYGKTAQKTIEEFPAEGSDSLLLSRSTF